MMENTKFDKLRGDNYLSWRFNMKLLLATHKVTGHCEAPFRQKPTEPEEPTGVAGASPSNTQMSEYRRQREKYETALQDYQEREELAWGLLCSKIEPPQQACIEQTKTAREAWKILEDTFDAKSVTQLVRLSRKFYAASLPEGGDIHEHIRTMTRLAQQLKEQGYTIPDDVFAITFLGSLPDSYETFLT